MVAGGLVKTWTSAQATVAQSSGEAEYYALVPAASEALGLQSIMKDLRWHASLRLWVDSSAAKAIASRVGLGRVRHLEVKFLWLQQTVKDKRIAILKVRGDCNPADVLTKPKSYKEVKELLKKVNVDMKTRADSNRSSVLALPVYYPDGCCGKQRRENFPIFPKFVPKHSPKDYTTFTSAGGHTFKEEPDSNRLTACALPDYYPVDSFGEDAPKFNWADALDDEREQKPLHEGYEPRLPRMSRILRPNSCLLYTSPSPRD